MSVTVDQLRAHSNITGTADDALLAAKLAAAQDHIERMLGYTIADRYGGEDQDPIPPSVDQAVLMLAAHWYEQRETAIEGSLSDLPFGVSDIVRNLRDWTF